jgi:hypothetical protein
MKKLLAFCAIAAAVMMMTGCEPYPSHEESLYSIFYLNSAKFNHPIEETSLQPHTERRGTEAGHRGGETHGHEGGYSDHDR